MNGKHALFVLLIGTLSGLPGISCNRGTSEKPLHAITSSGVDSGGSNQTEAQIAMMYELIPGNVLMWKGTAVTGGDHEGSLHLKSGWIGTSSDGKITSGDFVIDMNSIKSTDQSTTDSRSDLDAHLMNDDFFAVEQFPTARFTITEAVLSDSSDAYTVTGKLLLKGIQNTIRFPATITVHNDIIHVSAVCSIDRTLWGINYDSQKSLVNMLKNQGISDKIDISMDLQFRRKAHNTSVSVAGDATME